MPDQRNLILAIALSVLIFLGFELYLMLAAPVQQAEQAGQTVAESTPRAPGVEGASASGWHRSTKAQANSISGRYASRERCNERR